MSALQRLRHAMSPKLGACSLASVIVLGILLRSVNLFSPYLLDAHSFRQGDTAGFALGYLTQSFNPLSPSVARQPCSTPEPFGKVEAELPLYAWLAVIPLKVLGARYPSAVYLRCAWLAYFALACVYLYRLVRRLGESHAFGLLAVGSLCTLPLAVFFTVSIQPEGPSLTAAFAFLFYLTRYLQSRTLGDQARSVALATALLLFKLSNAYLGFGVVYLIVVHDGWRGLLLGRRYWSWLLLIVVPTAAWYWYSRHSSAWSFGIWDHGDKWSTWADLVNAGSWDRFGHRAFNEIFGWAGIALMCTGFASLGRSRVTQLAAALGLGFLAFLVLTVPVNTVHIYYQLPAVIPAALTIPVSVRALWSDGIGRWALAALALIHALSLHHALAPTAAQPHGGFFTENLRFLPAIDLVQRNVPEGERFASTSGAPELFYNSRHLGFMTSRRSTLDNVERCLETSHTSYLLVDPSQRRLLKDLFANPGALGTLRGAADGYLLFQTK